jgi:hypothetical protein
LKAAALTISVAKSANKGSGILVIVKRMETYDGRWVSAQVNRTIDVWRDCATRVTQDARRYSSNEQDLSEQAYDEALRAVEKDVQHTSRKPDRISLRKRLVASFGRFSATALHLEGDAIELLTREFLPVGIQLAQWARQHQPDLEMAAIIQAARNAWTACGLQPLLGAPVRLTPSILGYSLLYPHSDNYLDDVEIPVAAKLQFSGRFRRRLAGETLAPANDRERAVWELIALIEAQYPRERFPSVFVSLLAIHRAQEQSIGQLNGPHGRRDDDWLRLSVAKGGTSVLADACLANGLLSEQESRFAFEWGVLLQLGDDLQDIKDDMRRGSTTLFSGAATAGVPLDGLTVQLLNFSDRVGCRMDELPQGSACLKNLLKMSWRALIIRAVADSHEFFSSGFVREAERRSPFRFGFLRARNERLASRQGLYESLFEELLEDHEEEDPCLPVFAAVGGEG